MYEAGEINNDLILYWINGLQKKKYKNQMKYSSDQTLDLWSQVD